MADSNEPKKETVRIALPPKPQPAGVGAESPETARIHLPARPPMTSRPMPPPLSQTPLPPAPTRPISPPPSAAPLMPSGAMAASLSMPVAGPSLEPKKETARISVPGPKKETARITVLPDLPARPAPTVQMKKTQPLSRMPDVVPPSMPVNIATAGPEPEAIFDEVPMPFCWALLGVSTAILIIQIWTYIS
jgi:hypothetical protein